MEANEVRKQLAIDGLLEGLTVTAAAQRASVSRQTLSHWLNHDDCFEAQLSDARRAVRQAHLDRVAALTGKALDLIGERLAMGDSRVVRYLVKPGQLDLATGFDDAGRSESG